MKGADLFSVSGAGTDALGWVGVFCEQGRHTSLFFSKEWPLARTEREIYLG